MKKQADAFDLMSWWCWCNNLMHLVRLRVNYVNPSEAGGLTLEYTMIWQLYVDPYGKHFIQLGRTS